MATLPELENALRKADAAGNADDARAFANAIRQMRGAPSAEQPWQPKRRTVEDLRAEALPHDPTEGMTGGEKFVAGFGKSFVDSGRGLKQVGSQIANFVAPTSERQAGLAEQQRTIDLSRQTDAPLMGSGAGLAGNVAGYATQILAPGGLARGTMLAGAALPTTLAGNVAQGAVVAGLQPVATGESRAKNAATGAAFGAGGVALSKGIGALASRAKTAITPQVRELYEAAKARGITLTPAQISDSRFLKWTQSMLRSVPFTGAQGRFERQVGDFNRQLAGTIGEDAPLINSQVYASAKARQSAMFDDLTARNALKVDDRLVRSLSNIADNSRVSPKIAEEVEAAIDALYAQATTGPGGVVIPGAAYQAFDSQLGQIIKAGGSPAHFLGNVQTAVRRAMDDSISPKDAAAWKALRTEYGNRKTLTPLVAAAGDGPISPARVQGAVTATKAGKEAMASGTRGELGDLARIGQRMKEPPSSGTAERTLVGGMMGGGAMIDPVTGGLTAAGLNLLSRGLDSKALTKLIMRENPGMTREAVAKILRLGSKPAGQSYLSEQPLHLDIVGGTPISEAEARRRFGP